MPRRNGNARPVFRGKKISIVKEVEQTEKTRIRDELIRLATRPDKRPDAIRRAMGVKNGAVKKNIIEWWEENLPTDDNSERNDKMVTEIVSWASSKVDPGRKAIIIATAGFVLSGGNARLADEFAVLRKIKEALKKLGDAGGAPGFYHDWIIDKLKRRATQALKQR